MLTFRLGIIHTGLNSLGYYITLHLSEYAPHHKHTFGHGVNIFAPEPQDKIIVKRYPNSFHKTELDEYLKDLGIEKLIVCGMMTHMCVDTTVRAAMDYGYEVTVVADACATMDLTYNNETINAETVQKSFLASLDGVFATIEW